ncbi:hypothetical protein FDJ22_gp048 [Salmonella phage BPS17W1]|uniref:Uncharacterized protein n=3 Tax=Felixounavirus BPS17W1 TaxID=2560725 RepID=A0A2I6PGH5_9CAUD|nr:hypothetical protein FDJ22_gp048 [Salmonella phage BPS17W1]AUM59136.1 hypothetical protein BPS17W1_48 [Salmonella phage BPS17W1]AUM59279.1 hypothetical protein BPS15S6_62 [Salmonella phage BPS15S6]AUM59429.1 hypothetical protein BPS17S6_82 [Salmonella phage BPS17S6]
MFNKSKAASHVAKVDSKIEELERILANARESIIKEVEAVESQMQHLMLKRQELREHLEYIETRELKVNRFLRSPNV